MTDSKAPRNVVTSDFLAVMSTFASRTLPACSTSSSTVVLQGWWAGEAVGESGHDASKELTLAFWNSLRPPRSLATRWRNVEENILSSKAKETDTQIQ